MRDIIGLDKHLQLISGQAKASAAKISSIEEEIELLVVDLDADDLIYEDMMEIKEKIENLKVQRDMQRDHLQMDIEPRLRTQINRIRDTVYKMLYEDSTLGERVRTLFREQGITIVSIITALGMAIGALVEGILLATKTAASAITPKPPSPRS